MQKRNAVGGDMVSSISWQQGWKGRIIPYETVIWSGKGECKPGSVFNEEIRIA